MGSVLCITNASLSQNEKQLIMASVGSSLSFVHVAAQMRRLFGNIVSSRDMDVLLAHDPALVSDVDEFEAWVAFRKAKREGLSWGKGGSKGSASNSGKGIIKNPVNFRTGEVNRCFACKSEYH